MNPRRTEAAAAAPASSHWRHPPSPAHRRAPNDRAIGPAIVRRRRCVAAALPERSPRVLAIPLAPLPCPLLVVDRVSPLAPHDRRGRIVVVPVAYVVAPVIVRYHALSLRSQSWPRLCCSVPALPSEGCLGAATILLAPVSGVITKAPFTVVAVAVVAMAVSVTAAAADTYWVVLSWVERPPHPFIPFPFGTIVFPRYSLIKSDVSSRPQSQWSSGVNLSKSYPLSVYG